MINDFFLVERAAQVQRLRAAESGNRIDIPGQFSRLGCSPKATKLYKQLDRICKIPLSEKRKKWLSRLMARGGSLFGRRESQHQSEDDAPLLTPTHRTLLSDFERGLVQLQLSDDAESSTAASSIITAIRQDHRSFSGLKPLTLHSENFAYECLFPSWLNLYTALTAPTANSNEPRFTPDQVRTTFRFLEKIENGGKSPHTELVGLMTLVANRLTPADAHQLLQRIIDICCCKASDSAFAHDDYIGQLREQTTSADAFLDLINNLTLIKTCILKDQIVATFQIIPETPHYEALPASLSSHILALEGATDKFVVWSALVGQVGHIIAEGGCVDSEFADVLEHKSEALSEWLTLVTLSEDTAPLPPVCQRVLARIIQRTESQRGSLDVGTLHGFAQHMAPRFRLLDDRLTAYFEKEFIEHDSNRELMLRCTEDYKLRHEISQRLISRAGKTDNQNRMLSRLVIAAVFDPEFDREQLSGIGRTVQVLGILQEQGFISSNQLEEMANDIRRRLPGSIQFLVAPYLGASDQSGRLAKLYMALYEECEKFEHSGEIGNFGLTTAAYGNLNRTIDDDK